MAASDTSDLGRGSGGSHPRRAEHDIVEVVAGLVVVAVPSAVVAMVPPTL